MKIKHFPFGVLILLILFSLCEPVKAAPAEYGRAFGLLVHQQNENMPVNLGRGQQILDSYFTDTLLRSSYEDQTELMTQRDFLLHFEKSRLKAEGKETIFNDQLLYPMVWLTARRNNWLPDTRLTYKTMREFLYRYSVSEKFGGIPYFEGLVLDEEEIHPGNYKSINQVTAIQNDLSVKLNNLRKSTVISQNQQTLLKTLVVYAEKFDNLNIQLKELYHPLNVLPDLPDDIRQKILDYDLNEILNEISYDYSGNTVNRIHNLTAGLAQMNGRVFMPDEIINFEQELGRNGWGIYKYGWVIFGGIEAWQFGGGLCGSATMIFTPSWRAGLEIIRRFPHSAYYSSLYPAESLGLDATIYRGHKNLIMKNTTGSPLMYYVYNNSEKKEITVYLVGRSPYRSVSIEGSIKTAWGTYKWIRRMERFDGTVVEEELVTRYGLMY